MSMEDVDDSVDVTSYCESKLCLGLQMEVSSQKIDKESECPVCYERFQTEKVLMLNKCRHAFCQKCFQDMSGYVW